MKFNIFPKLEKTSSERKYIINKLMTDLLNKSDWTQVPDVPLTGPERAAWAQYRQQLRDIKTKLNDPNCDLDSIVIPQKP